MSSHRNPPRTVVVEGGLVFTTKPDHYCVAPNADDFDDGDIFECGKCHKKFERYSTWSYQGYEKGWRPC